MENNTREFKVKVVEKDGKKMIEIKAQTEIIKHPSGRQDVIVHAPSLSLIAEQLKLGGK